MKSHAWSLNASLIENPWKRRAVIVLTFPFFMLGNLIYWPALGLWAAVTSPIALFQSARSVW